MTVYVIRSATDRRTRRIHRIRSVLSRVLKALQTWHDRSVQRDQLAGAVQGAPNLVQRRDQGRGRDRLVDRRDDVVRGLEVLVVLENDELIALCRLALGCGLAASAAASAGGRGGARLAAGHQRGR